MLRLKYLVLLFFFLLSINTNAQDPNWNSMLTVPPNPSPYFSDWENNPNNITYSLEYSGEGTARVTLGFEIFNSDNNELLRGASEVIEFSGPERKDITGTELVNWDETTWSQDIEAQVIRTGRFPEGDYTACITAYDMNNLGLTESCIDFSITYPDPPYLIAPLTDENILSPLPTFQWAPVINNYSNEDIKYKILIVELLKGQTPEQAIAGNPAHLEETTTMTAFPYPPSGQIIEKNKTYAWQIQALDMDDVPIAANDGKSVIWTFKYKDMNALAPNSLSLDVAFTQNSISYFPNHLSNSADINISLNGSTEDVIKIDSVINYWYKKDGSLYKIKRDKIYQTIMEGETISRKSNLTLSNSDLTTALDGKQSTEYYVHIAYSGKDKNGNKVNGITKTPLLVKLSSQSENQNNSVEFITKEIKYAPNILQNKVKIKFTHYADLTSPYIEIDSCIYYWYKENNNLFFKEKYQTSFKADYAPYIYEEEPSFDLQTFTNALDGKDSANYKLHIKYIGKEKNGQRVTATTKTPLLVKLYSSKTSPLKVEFLTKEVSFYPNALNKKVKINVMMGGSNEEVVIDSSINYWYKEDNTSYIKDKAKIDSYVIKSNETIDRSQPFSFDNSSLTVALAGKDSAKYFVYLEYAGKDKNGQRVTGKTKSPLLVKYYASKINPLKVEFINKEIIFAPNILSNLVDIKLSMRGLSNEEVTLDSVINYWYKKDNDSSFKIIRDKVYKNLTVAGGTTIYRESNLKFTKNSLTDALNGKQNAEYYVNMEYIGKNKNGEIVKGKTQTPLVVKCSSLSKQLLNVAFNPKTISITPTHLKNTVNIKLTYQGEEEVTLDSVINYWYKKDNDSLFKIMRDKVYKNLTVTGGTTTDRESNLKFTKNSLTDALNGKQNAEYYVNMEYIGKNKKGEIVKGKTQTPLVVKCFATDLKVYKGTNFVIIPGKVFIKPVAQTVVNKNGNKLSMDGQAKLILTSDPFKKDSAIVEVENLSFTKDKKIYKVSGGTFSGNTIGNEDDVFHFKVSGLKIQVQKISYTYSKINNRLFLNKAFSKLPVIGKKLYFKNLIVDKNGLDYSMSKQEFKVFGLVFVVKEIKKQKFSSGNSKFSLGVGIRLNSDKHKKEKDEFFSGKLVFQKIKNGETTVELQGATGGSDALFHLVPYTNYLNISSLKFVQKPNKNWAMAVGVTSAELPIYSKIIKDPIKTTFMFEKSGKMTGKLELINETTHGYDDKDKTVLKIGKIAAIDLTYLGFQIEQIQKITTVDAKPDTSWEFDFSKSKIAISGDLYLASKNTKLNDAKNRIAFGEFNNPGITIDFNGKVKTQTITVTKNKKLDLGPLFLEMTTFALTPYPFDISVSGNMGVDMKGVVNGGFKVAGLKINGDGEFTNFNDVVKAGKLKILKTVGLSIGGISYSSTPKTLSLPNGNDTKNSSLKVNSYFRLKGAKLDIEGGVAGGGFQELLVYKPQDGKTNFILDDAEVNIGSTASLKISMQYVKNAQNEYLGVGGKATVLNKYGATLYGKIGQRTNATNPEDNAYWGFFIALDLGEGIPLGPVNLTGVGGGFFYRPLKSDISTIVSLAKFKPLKISGVDLSGKPKPALEQKWALFLYAALNVGGDEFINGKALVTVTDSYFKLNANVKAIKNKVTGNAYLNINWKQEFVEGKFNFGLDFVVLKAEESKNYLQFYAYKKSNWGITGKIDMTIMLISKVQAETYIGNKGFLFDFIYEQSIDISFIEGGFRLETMAWWKKGVNWGLYASGKVWGEVLWGLVGAEIGVEGALISNPFLIYVGGHLSVSVLWVISFDGNAWISIDENGFDGGTGRNKKFDKLIADARNTGKQMQKEMNDMKKKLQDTRDALYRLSEAQRKAAGKALIQLSVWAEKDGWKNMSTKEIEKTYNAFMIKVQYEKDLYLDTLDGNYSRINSSANSWTNKSVTPEPALKQVFDLIWNSQAKKLDDIKNKLKQDSIDIASAIDDIENMENQLSSLLTENREFLEEELPTISELGKLKNPATKPQPKSYTITINNVSKSVNIYNYTLDSTGALNQKNKVAAQKKETDAYHKQLVAMVGEYIKKLRKMREIISGNKNSIKVITKKYADTFVKISNYTTRFMDYLNTNQYWAINQSNKLKNLKSAIDNYYQDASSINNLFKSIEWLKPYTAESDPRFKKLCSRRINLIKELIKMGAAKDFAPPQNDITLKNYSDMGKELYYEIPYAGYSSVADEMSIARTTLVKDFKANNDIYQSNWANFTIKSDKVYSRQVKLYTILYDLLDQLSLQAGTRKIERGSDNLLVGTRNTGASDILNTIPIVEATGTVGKSSGNYYNFGDISTTGSSVHESGSFTQAIQSGRINAVTGNNISQSRINSRGTFRTADWVKDMDFEKERKKVKKILQVPKIVQFTGKAISDKNTMGYAKLTLKWKGEHPIGIAEYSFSIDGYSDVVQASDYSSGNNSSGNSESNVVGARISPFDLQGFYSGNENNTSEGNSFYDATDVKPDNNYGTGYEFYYPNAGPPKNWRTLGNKESIMFPFLDGVHKVGNYNVWLRARGAGGYTIERLSSIYIDYYGAASKTSDFDFSKKESSLKTTDHTPPTTPSVIDNGDKTSSAKQIFAKWSAADYESGIQEYEYRVVYEDKSGRTPSVIPWTSAGGQTEMNIRLDEKLKPGRIYYVEVKAVNGVGMWSGIGSSNGIQLSDSTPPTAPSFSGSRGRNQFSNTITFNDSLLAGSWSAASDPETGVLGYLFAVGTAAGTSNIINWCATKSTKIYINKNELSKLLNVELQRNTTYYFSVKAVNGIGIVGEAAHILTKQ